MVPVSEIPAPGQRLDSWKAIAEYLRRDVATVARWEKTLGLPVRRVAGAGRSVFAYTSEIEGWLQTAKATLPEADLVPSAPPAPTLSIGTWSWPWLVLTAAVLALVAALMARARPIGAGDLRVELTNTGLVARDPKGVEQWRHPFPATHTTFTVPGVPARVIGGRSPGVYFATGLRGSQTSNQMESGVITLLDLKGRLQRSFAFDDRLLFQGASYGAPWAITGFDVNEADGTYRVAVSAHHYTWDPGLVTILDNRWQRRGTFVHAGWVELVHWLGPERLLIGGFSNARDGGMLALLDPAAVDGQGPEPEGSRHFCQTCGPDRPLRMLVFPRTEINRVTAARFNRVLVETVNDRVVARTIEMPLADGDAVALYELTSSLDLVGAKFGERYWDMHRTLEAEGRIAHTREQCPDRDGPQQVHMWEPATGWQTVPIR
jgi:hypothetical protein